MADHLLHASDLPGQHITADFDLLVPVIHRVVLVHCCSTHPNDVVPCVIALVHRACFEDARHLVVASSIAMRSIWRQDPLECSTRAVAGVNMATGCCPLPQLTAYKGFQYFTYTLLYIMV